MQILQLKFEADKLYPLMLMQYWKSLFNRIFSLKNTIYKLYLFEYRGEIKGTKKLDCNCREKNSLHIRKNSNYKYFIL